jgi:octaprenyl-diphosphate synthase
VSLISQQIHSDRLEVPSELLKADPLARISHSLLPVAYELGRLESVMLELLSSESVAAQKILQQVFSGGGKRIRPALFYLAAKLVKYDQQFLHSIAAVTEFVHAASLLHDDVIDNSSLRRGKPSANKIWGDESAVLTGDLIYSRASELMAQTGSLEIVEGFARSIRLMSEGELIQLENLYQPNMSKSVYFSIIERKTSVLLGMACRAPGLLKGLDPSFNSALQIFGENIGFAFQLIDDALDYAGKEDVFGKSTLADLPNGKVTLPIILLRDEAPLEIWKEVAAIISSKHISRADMLRVLDVVNEFDTVGKTLELAEWHTNRALNAIEKFDASSDRTNLEVIARSLLIRNF